MYVKVAHHAGGAADLLQLAQPALACLFRGLAQTARAGLARQRLERRFHAARAGAQLMDGFHLRIVALLPAGIEAFAHRRRNFREVPQHRRRRSAPGVLFRLVFC